MKKMINFAIILSSLFTLYFILSTTALADSSQQEVGFNIQMVPAENQINKQDSFFDLKMTPGKEQTIYVRVNNTSDTEGNYTMHINQAYTNPQGFIDYANPKEASYTDLPYKISDIADFEEKITVKANESKDVPIKLTMPKEEYDGQILAGIQILKETGSSAQIDVDYGYILGLKLTETDKPITRKVELIDVQPEVAFGNPGVTATIQNPTMDAYGHLVYDVTILKKSNKEKVFSKIYDNGMELAPHSRYPFKIEFKDQRLVPDDYILQMKVTDAKDNEWTFEEEFNVSKKQANDINKITIDQGKEAGIPYYVWIAGGMLLLLIIIYILKKIIERR